MASLSARLWGKASFMWCRPVFAPVCVCVCVCVHMFVFSLCTDIIAIGY